MSSCQKWNNNFLVGNVYAEINYNFGHRYYDCLRFTSNTSVNNYFVDENGVVESNSTYKLDGKNIEIYKTYINTRTFHVISNSEIDEYYDKTSFIDKYYFNNKLSTFLSIPLN